MSDTTTSSTPPPRAVDRSGEERLDDLLARVPSGMRVQSRASREVFEFTAPSAADAGFRTLGLVRLTHAEEEAVYRKMPSTKFGDGFKTAVELAKTAIATVDGVRVSAHDASLEEAFSRFSPPGRELLLLAFRKIHNTKKEHVADFLESMTVRT